MLREGHLSAPHGILLKGENYMKATVDIEPILLAIKHINENATTSITIPQYPCVGDPISGDSIHNLLLWAFYSGKAK